MTRWSLWFKGLIHFSSLFVLLHTQNDVEISGLPFVSQAFEEIWISIFGVWKFCLNHIKCKLFWKTFTAVISSNSCLRVRWIREAELFRDEVWASEKNCQNDNTLEDSLTKDVFYHLSWNDILLLSVWGSHQQFWFWSLGCKSQGSKRIHDQVNPKKLNWREWTFYKGKGANETWEESDNVDTELELKESSNVVKNISSPWACLNNACKVIILDNNIGCCMSNLSSSCHSKTNISFSEGWSIICTISSDSNNISTLFQTGYHDVFVIGTRSGQNF